MITPYQYEYFFNYLNLKSRNDDFLKVGKTVMSSKIALNPHQIYASLEFFNSPFKKGLIFADEVGLGKTIEAGIVISQKWFEYKRKILIIAPASLLKQWQEELYDKFGLNPRIIVSANISQIENWKENIYICSYHTAYNNHYYFKDKLDLVVIDEAHKLRNVYKESSLMSNVIKDTFADTKKLMLTATPFQNNLLELYGLLSVIDEDTLEDIDLFKHKYINNFNIYSEELKKQIDKYFVRTLRKDVEKYINFTKRKTLLQDYCVTEEEKQFYNNVSSLIYDENFSKAYDKGAKHLLSVLLQKLLSSSNYAVMSTLKKIFSRLNLNNLKSQEKLIYDILSTGSKISQKADSKFKALSKILKEIYQVDTFEGNRKIIIFTEC